jgi:hypothetical protein
MVAWVIVDVRNHRDEADPAEHLPQIRRRLSANAAQLIVAGHIGERDECRATRQHHIAIALRWRWHGRPGCPRGSGKADQKSSSRRRRRGA